MCAAMVDRNPDYPSGDYGRSMYDSRPSYDYNQPSYQGQDYGQERYDPPSQYQRAPDPPVQKPVYYTTGSPEQGLQIGNYAQARKVLDNERHRDYNRFMKEKEDQANRRRDEALHRREASPPRQPNQTEMYDHNQVSQQLREERRKEYNDYLDHPKQVKNDRPQGTPSQQQKEQILNRAQHQLEIPVIDRRQAYSDRPPPNNPPQDRPTSGRWDPETYRQNAFAPVKRVTSPPHQANIGHDDYGQYRRQNEHEVRNKEYNDFLAKKQYMEDEKKQKLVEQRRQAPAPIVKGDYYDSEQYDLRRQALNEQQHRDYQNYLRGHDGQRKRPPTPDSLQGLPLSQRQYDSMRKMQEIQRNKEYNALLAKKGFDKHQPPETNRHPEFGIKSEFQDQDAAGRQSQRNMPLGSLITGDRVDYPSSADLKFNRERRKEYNEYIKPQDLQNIHRKREEAISKIEAEGIDLDKVRIFPQGEYQDKHKQLQEEWKKNFRDFAAKKHEIVKKELEERERTLAGYYLKEIDNPMILPAGEYKDKQRNFQKQWRDECRDYYSGHPVVLRSKDIWKADDLVHTIPQSGEYKGRRERLNTELRKEFKEYQSQKTPPKDRPRDYGKQGAVLFDPLYNKEVRSRVREERSKDFQDFLEKQDAERFRKQENARPDNRIGFMSHLGKPVEEMRERLNKERHEDYNKYLQSDNWQKESGGSRSRPPSNKSVPTPSYEEMLEKKRREEASYRRYDDPEYSRSGGERRNPNQSSYDAPYRRSNQD